MKNKLRKSWTIFDRENWLWKLDLGTFWYLPITPICKILKISVGLLIDSKNLSNFVPPAWKLDNLYYHMGQQPKTNTDVEDLKQ